ncbi:hypothetical protein BLA29_008278, partial [Euroglyphus maynei]
DPNSENVNLKDIKIIFIPIKNLQQNTNQSNNQETPLIESDMKQLTDEIKEQLQLTNSNQPKMFNDNGDHWAILNSTIPTTTTSTVSMNSTEQTEAPIMTEKLFVTSPKSTDVDEIMIDDYDDYGSQQQQPSSSSSKNLEENHYTVEPQLAPSIGQTSKPENFTKKEVIRTRWPSTKPPPSYKPPSTTTTVTPSSLSSAPFPIPSLESEWLKQNSYVPRARYYKAPELKILHHMKPFQDDKQYQQMSKNILPQRTSQSITNQWSPIGSQNEQPSHPIQFLYSVSHANNVPLQSIQQQQQQSSTFNFNPLTLSQPRPYIQPLQMQSSSM